LSLAGNSERLFPKAQTLEDGLLLRKDQHKQLCNTPLNLEAIDDKETDTDTVFANDISLCPV
jgi:hypothetical protein